MNWATDETLIIGIPDTRSILFPAAIVLPWTTPEANLESPFLSTTLLLTAE